MTKGYENESGVTWWIIDVTFRNGRRRRTPWISLGVIIEPTFTEAKAVSAKKYVLDITQEDIPNENRWSIIVIDW